MRLARMMGGLAAVLALSLPAHAQLFRAYLSSAGSDTNPCTLAAPCRLLPAGLAAVANGGEIWMLDSANYNNSVVVITKSVSVLARPGAIGSIVAVDGGAITISGAGVKVALTNLMIVPLNGAGGSGIVMNLATGASLVVDRVTFSRLPGDGLVVLGAIALRVSNSSFVDIGQDAVSLSGNASGEISNVKMSRIGRFGVALDAASGTTTAAITDTTISGAANCGVFSYSPGAQAQAFLTRVTITASSCAASAQGGGGALVSLSDSTIQGNNTGVFFSAGTPTIATFGNNAIANNVNNILGGTMTAVAMQ